MGLFVLFLLLVDLAARGRASYVPGLTGTVKEAKITENGPSGGTNFGTSIAVLGDMDGDSVTDLCVGAYSDDDGGTDAGAVWVLFLNSDGSVKRSSQQTPLAQKISSLV